MSGAVTIYTPQLRDVEAQMLPYVPKFEELLPASITPKMMLTAAMSNLMNNGYAAKIAAENPLSVAMSLMTSCTLMLIPDGVTGQGHLVPYGGKKPKITFMPGYQGYITIAERGAFTLEAFDVCVTDEFERSPAAVDNPIHHVIRHPRSKKDRGDVQGYYAIAKHASQPMRHWWMEMDDIIVLRDTALDRLDEKWKRDQSPWTVNFPAMARKSPIRFLGKNMPLKQLQLAAGIESLNEDAGRPAYLRGPNEAIIEGRIIEADEIIKSTGSDWEAPQPLKLVDPNGVEHTGKIPHMWAAKLISWVGQLPADKLQTFVLYNDEHIKAAETAGHVLQARMVREAIKSRQTLIAKD